MKYLESSDNVNNEHLSNNLWMSFVGIKKTLKSVH